MSEAPYWRWISKQALILLHDESLVEHGGGSGLRDESLLDSVLARAPNLAHHGEPDVAALAASYGTGLAKNHPFVDGNKRAAFLAVGMFLYLNRYKLTATQAEATSAMLALAGGDLTEDQFAAWLRLHIQARQP